MNTFYTKLRHVGNIVSNFWSRHRCLLSIASYRRYRRWAQQQNRELAEGKPLVIFDFSNSQIDGPQGRRFYALFMFFVRAGYYPVLIERYRFLHTINKRHKAFCADEPFALMSRRHKTHLPHVLVTDLHKSRCFESINGAQKKLLQLDFRPDFLNDGEGFPMPFPMFPGVYRSGNDKDAVLEVLRNRSRRWSVFFGGKAKTKAYSKKSITDVYQKVPRAKALACLREHLPNATWVEPSSQIELHAELPKTIRGVLAVNMQKCKIDVNEWLESVATARFFLALPGVRYPMSHNLVEALAVGTVPITEYPELFFPPLEHGNNCLVYAGEQSLVEVVEQAVNMPEEQWRQLSAAAAEYYSVYMHPVKTINRLLAGEDTSVRLRLLPFLKTGGGFA